MKFVRLLQLALFLASFPLLGLPVFGQYRVGISGTIPIAGDDGLCTGDC